jgi:TatD DNase family protein
MMDAHCHLESIEGLDAKIGKWRAQLAGFVTCGYDLTSSRANLEIAKRHPGHVWAVAGLAPQGALKASREDLQIILSFIRDNADSIVAIGEIGLDYKWAKTDAEKRRQMETFEAQILLAKELDLPVVIHSRLAEKQCIEKLSEMGCERVMQHCFGGDAELAQHAADAGHYISIPPLRAKERKKVIKAVELDLLLAESDAPAIGKEPISALEAAAMIAEIKGVERADVDCELEANCRRLFKL